ncbi:MAG: mandelate racemase [Candidatus Eremiobacteraeota bacterium]|nr:mandelate racemase [Candidatus Eremiobacteraeota bacterium]
MTAEARCGASVERVEVSAYKIPTADAYETDGTAKWDHTTLVLVEVEGGGQRGIGYSYADSATATMIRDTLATDVQGEDVMQTGKIWAKLVGKIRNMGRPGISAMAISAVDNALWDLKARLLDVPLVTLLGPVRDGAELYGSGGFTSFSVPELQQHMTHWVEMGIPRVKMKIGRDPTADIARIRAVREAIGEHPELFVDANGAYSRKQAIAQAERFAQYRVTWYEEPVYHHDLEGLHLVRDRAPAEMEISAGEYGYDPMYFERMLAAQAVDVLQADCTRAEGITGFLVADGLCEARLIPLSTHCAPAQSLHPACAAKRIRNMEYFYDHVRIEEMLFDGVQRPVDGLLKPDLSRPGIGLEFKRSDAKQYAV